LGFNTLFDDISCLLLGSAIVACLLAREQLVLHPRLGHDGLAALAAEVGLALHLRCIGHLTVALSGAVDVGAHALALRECV